MNKSQEKLLTETLLYLVDTPVTQDWKTNTIIHTAIKSHLECMTKLPRRMCNEFLDNYVKV